MKNKILTLAVLSATSLTFLSACGSGSGITGINSNENAMPSITDRVASIRVVGNFNNGGTTDFTEAAQNDDTYDYTYSETQETLNLRVRNNNTLIMIVNGVETPLTRVANNDSWIVSQGINTSVTDFTSFSFSANDNNLLLLDVIRGTDETIHGTYVLYSTDPNDYDSGESSFDTDSTAGFATVGIQTPASVVTNQTATATYDGLIAFRTYPHRQTTGNIFSREQYSGNLSMNVNFNANTIRGTANLSNNDDTQNTVVGVVNFAPAPIIGNGFEGNFTLDSGLRDDIGLTDNPIGSYAGNFFGENADDLAGVLQLNGTNANGIVFGIGGFRGDRQ